MKRTLTVLSALAGLLALLSLGALPASASVSSGVVGGAVGSTILDDWGDEGPLSVSSHAHSGATYLWQWILYADGAKHGSSSFSKGDIDGDFGPNTKAATEDWQRDHHLDDDGIVGPLTFGNADGRLRVLATGGNDIHIRYLGTTHLIDVYRLGGVYWSHDPDSSKLVKATYGAPVFGAPPAQCIFDGTCS